MKSARFLLVASLLWCACGDSRSIPAEEPQRVVVELLGSGQAPAEDGVHVFGAFARGPAAFEVRLEGPGSEAPSRLTCERAGEGASRALESEFSGGRGRLALPLDEGETSAVRLSVTLPEGARLIRAALLSAPLADGRAAAPPDPPDLGLRGALAGRDLVLFVADSLHAAHLSSYGSERETSPFLDALARRGVRFDVAYSQTSWTLASMTSVFTSLEQERHGVQRMDHQLATSFTTLAELFQDAGYATAAIVQNAVVRPETGLAQGFERYEVMAYEAHGTDDLVARARELLFERRDERPLFLYLHLTPPHMPYQPPEPHANLFTDQDYAGEVDGSILSCATIDKQKPARDGPDVRQLEALYDGHIHFADARMGGLVQELIEAERGAQSAVVVTSDHGEAFLQHGKQGHNAQVFEEMVRVPLLFWAPQSALPAGHVAREPVMLLDVMPTLAELFGLGVPSQGFGGRSLTPLFERAEAGPGPPPGRPMFFTSRYPESDPFERIHAGVRVGNHKLVLRRGVAQLFDLALDPGESVDLSADEPILSAALRGTLERWFHTASAQGARAASRSISSDVEAELSALGYTGDELEDDGQEPR